MKTTSFWWKLYLETLMNLMDRVVMVTKKGVWMSQKIKINSLFVNLSLSGYIG